MPFTIKKIVAVRIRTAFEDFILCNEDWEERDRPAAEETFYRPDDVKLSSFRTCNACGGLIRVGV